MMRKTETMNLRVTPELKELVKLAAEREHRTASNFIDFLVRDYCDRHNIAAVPVISKKGLVRSSGKSKG